MNPAMKSRQAATRALVDSNELTAGMYVRVRGDELILGRADSGADSIDRPSDDRIKLSHLGANHYGLSVKRHTGRWQPTPFSGQLEEVFETIWTFMQHLVADYS